VISGYELVIHGIKVISVFWCFAYALLRYLIEFTSPNSEYVIIHVHRFLIRRYFTTFLNSGFWRVEG